MPRRYAARLAESAEEDLRQAFDFIARDSPVRALSWVETMEARIRTLERFPDRGPMLPEAQDIGGEYRHLVEGNYRIVYRVDGRTVHVIRVIHAARLLDTSILDE